MRKQVVIAVLVIVLLVTMAVLSGCKSKSGEEIEKQIQEERGLTPGTVPPPPGDTPSDDAASEGSGGQPPAAPPQ